MNIKYFATAAVLTAVIIGNAAIYMAQDTINQDLAETENRSREIASSNNLLLQSIDALEAEYNQAQSEAAALAETINNYNKGNNTSASSFSKLIDDIDPVTVRITAPGPGLRGFASGVLVSPEGYILTVLHNVDNPSYVRVTLNTGEEFDASIVDIDAQANLALLKIDSDRTDFPAAEMGSMSGLETGQAVIAAGYPMSDELPGPATFTYGIVSALRTADDYYFIQSEVPIGQGSGGGGLFTMNGKVIGLASLAQGTGIYLFVPIDLAEPLLELIP